MVFTLRPSYLRGKTRYQLNRRLGGPAASQKVFIDNKTSNPRGFELRCVHPRGDVPVPTTDYVPPTTHILSTSNTPSILPKYETPVLYSYTLSVLKEQNYRFGDTQSVRINWAVANISLKIHTGGYSKYGYIMAFNYELSVHSSCNLIVINNIQFNMQIRDKLRPSLGNTGTCQLPYCLAQRCLQNSTTQGCEVQTQP